MKRFAMPILLSATIFGASGTRLKELASWEGVRDNQLMGYGLIVGLAGTGDKPTTVFSAQTLANLLQRMGVSINPTQITVRNTASVMVTATLPPFAQPGTRIDITAGAIGDSSNLQGGMLLLTPLKAADGKTYAVAQGNVLTGGFLARGGGATQTVNHPTVGRIPDGAIVEQAPPVAASRAEAEAAIAASRLHYGGACGRGREPALRPRRTAARPRRKLRAGHG
jgi:flagellar P-ring protein precursor FlgI